MPQLEPPAPLPLRPMSHGLCKPAKRSVIRGLDNIKGVNGLVPVQSLGHLVAVQTPLRVQILLPRVTPRLPQHSFRRAGVVRLVHPMAVVDFSGLRLRYLVRGRNLTRSGFWRNGLTMYSWGRKGRKLRLLLTMAL